MSALCGIVTQIIVNKNDYCYLCFKRLGEDSFHIQDEIVWDSNGCPRTEEMFKILINVVGAQFSDIKGFELVCNVCTKSAIIAYRFINMCKENLDHLSNTVDSLNDCFENTTDDLQPFKSLFVALDTKDFSSQQYYSKKEVKKNTVEAFKTFQCYISQEKRLQHRNEPKLRKQHNFNDETFLEICDLIREKNSPTQFKCKVCSNVFKKSFNFKKHYYSQHSPKVLKCSECPRSYGSEALLKQHKYDCHASMVCSECGKKYTNRYSLLYHMRRHTGEEPYECKYCGQKFQWSSRRAEHIRRMHMEPGIECEICHAKFKALGSLYDHRKRHFNPNSRLHVVQNVIEEEVTEEPGISWEETIVTSEDIESK